MCVAMRDTSQAQKKGTWVSSSSQTGDCESVLFTKKEVELIVRASVKTIGDRLEKLFNEKIRETECDE